MRENAGDPDNHLSIGNQTSSNTFAPTIFGRNDDNRSSLILIGSSISDLSTDPAVIDFDARGVSGPLVNRDLFSWRSFAGSKEMVMSASGNLGINVEDPTEKLHVVGNGYVTGDLIVDGNIGINEGDPTEKLHVVGNGYVTGDFTVDGTFTNPSDLRFKKNIVTIEQPMDKLKKIRGVYYDWKQNNEFDRSFSTDGQIGVIAQEVEAVFPELVKTDKFGMKAVDYVKLTAVLLEAIKVQQQEIEMIKQQLKELK